MNECNGTGPIYFWGSGGLGHKPETKKTKNGAILGYLSHSCPKSRGEFDVSWEGRAAGGHRGCAVATGRRVRVM